MMKETELKPCPFCGSEDVKTVTTAHDAGMSGIIKRVAVQCLKCHATGGVADDWDDYHQTIEQNKTLEDFAIERWNRRSEKMSEEKNCKDCLHLEACSKWTDFPKQIGFPTCSKFDTTESYRKQSEEGAECPTCYGTGRIGTTDWLTKNISKKQLAEEKAKAIAEHELHIKQDYAREIFAEICSVEHEGGFVVLTARELAELKKKYTEKDEGGAE